MTLPICPPFVVSSLRHARPLRLRCKARWRPRWSVSRRRWTCSISITRWRRMMCKCTGRPQGNLRQCPQVPLEAEITRRVGRRLAMVASLVCFGRLRLARHLEMPLYSRTGGRALAPPSRRSRRRRRVARSHHHRARNRLIAVRYIGRDRLYPCSAPSRLRDAHTARQVRRNHAT